MADVSRQIEIYIEKEFANRISKGTIRKAAQSAAVEAVNAIRDRTAAGISYKGTRIPRLTKNYEFRKRTELSELTRGKKTTKWKAVKTPNHGRLTGQFFSAMTYKIKRTQIRKNSIDIIIELDLKGDQEKKVKWLESSTGATRGWGGKGKKKTYSKKQRYIWGLSQGGAWRNKERQRISLAFKKSFVKNAKIKVT